MDVTCMKRLVSTVCAAAVVCAVLAGCGGNDIADSSRLTDGTASSPAGTTTAHVSTVSATGTDNKTTTAGQPSTAVPSTTVKPITSAPVTNQPTQTTTASRTTTVPQISTALPLVTTTGPKDTSALPVTTTRPGVTSAPTTTVIEIAGEPVITPSGRVWQPRVKSTVADAPDKSWDKGVGCPSVIVLEHSGSRNGLIIAAYSVADSGLTGGRTSLRIARSSDGGHTFVLAAKVYESFDTTIEACWNPHLFELPTRIGDMPAGTLLLAGGSIDPGQSSKSTISIWRSFDCGESWEQYSVVAEGGGIGDGVWEPFLLCENGYLYCFYSDDATTKHSQSLVYKKSSDGKNWSGPHDMVAPDDYAWRPGMISIAKMGNGKFFAVYEVGSDKGGGVPVYYKITDSPDNWDSRSLGKKLTAKNGQDCGSAPWCAWSPVGGECGTLVVSAKYGTGDNRLFVSYDYGETFELVENPLNYPNENGYGYSASLFFSSDGKTLYYANTTDNGKGKAKIEFVKIGIS